MAQKLDFESRGPAGDRDGKYIVVVEVRDPSANIEANIGYDFVVVVITAEDINEDPVLEGRSELTIEEINSSAADAANPDFDGQPDPIGEAAVVPTVNVYKVSDPDQDSGTGSWDLEGEDAGEFQLIGTVGRTLVFVNQPDYENPADVDGDNVYKVTVVTFDGRGGRAEFDVCIAVMNINEEGEITLLGEDGNELVRPRAQGPITAELTDPDGGVTGITWVWARSPNDPPFEPEQDFTGSMSKTYTPTNTDTGYFLRVTAMYMDELSATEVAAGAGETGVRMAEATAPHAVLEVEDKGQDPAFPPEHADGVEREIAENSPSSTYVGEAIVEAVDPDKGTTLIYTLEDIMDGEDAKFFALVTRHVDDDNDPQTPANDDDGDPNTIGDVPVNTRQIVVANPMLRAGTGPDAEPATDPMYDPTDLDHEDDKKNTYTVVLKASDGNADTDDATITVTITVTDRNEAPSTPMVASGGAVTPPDANNAPEFPATETGMRSVPENTAAGENIGAPVMAMDDDAGDTLTYTLGGDDMASFDIDGTGQLMTMAALDFEMPADADMDNAYEVTVTASDGTDEAMVAVTITVTNVGLDESYDADDNGIIDEDEARTALTAYFADVITEDRARGILSLYFSN